MTNDSTRILVHFSCGAASAVALKVAVTHYSNRHVEAVYCDLSGDEHPDNQRFLDACEQWAGVTVTRLTHARYRSIDDLFLDQQFIASARGAICTRVMKRELIERYSKPNDLHVIGYTADERSRQERFVAANPGLLCWWPLIAAGITKSDCFRFLQAAGIELPVMYRLGYGHNNCIGCVKGGKGYWNKIRQDFPDVFARRSLVQREIGVGAAFRSGGDGFMLDELDPTAGRLSPEPTMECGLFCDSYNELLHAIANEETT